MSFFLFGWGNLLFGHGPSVRMRLPPYWIHPARTLPTSSAGRDYHELPPVHLIRRRRGVSSGWQRGFPQQLSGSLVEGVKFLVVIAGADEHEPARGHYRSAVILRPRVGHALCHQFRILA